MPDPESRLARQEQKMDDLQHEVQRVRDRVHDLEGDRVAIALLTEKLSMLADQTHRLADQLHTIASQAAREAVQLALDARDRLSDSKRGFQFQGVATGAAVSAIVLSIIFHFV